MDADTRHQLKTNELADALARLKDFTDRRTLSWLALIVAIALAWGGYRYWGWRQQARLTQASGTLLSVGNVLDPSRGEAPLAQLRQIIAENHDPGLVALAHLRLGQGLEARGMVRGDTATLDEAQRHYQAVLASAAAPNHVKAAAGYRLGLVHESRRDFAKAREAYTALTRDGAFAGSPFVGLAESRLAQLDRLAVPIAFEPGLKPPPATQAAEQPQAEATPEQAVPGVEPPATGPPVVGEPPAAGASSDIPAGAAPAGAAPSGAVASDQPPASQPVQPQQP